MYLTASSAASMYERLALQREPYLRRGRDCAKLTIPHLLTEEGWNGTQKLYTPFQGVGAASVSSLSSKLLMALFPRTPPSSGLLSTPTSLSS